VWVAEGGAPVTAQPSALPRGRRRPADRERLTRIEVIDLMRRGYVRPLEEPPALHQMARRRKDIADVDYQTENTTTTEEST
jgi:hypothetical protein